MSKIFFYLSFIICMLLYKCNPILIRGLKIMILLSKLIQIFNSFPLIKKLGYVDGFSINDLSWNKNYDTKKKELARHIRPYKKYYAFYWGTILCRNNTHIRHRYFTNMDIAEDLNISPRTASRLLSSNDKYSSKYINRNNLTKLWHVKDNINKHCIKAYKRNGKWIYKNGYITCGARNRPQIVVDATTYKNFVEYKIAPKPKLDRAMKRQYSSHKTTKEELINKLINRSKKLLIANHLINLYKKLAVSLEKYNLVDLRDYKVANLLDLYGYPDIYAAEAEITTKHHCFSNYCQEKTGSKYVNKIKKHERLQNRKWLSRFYN